MTTQVETQLTSQEIERFRYLAEWTVTILRDSLTMDDTHEGQRWMRGRLDELFILSARIANTYQVKVEDAPEKDLDAAIASVQDTTVTDILDEVAHDANDSMRT